MDNIRVPVTAFSFLPHSVVSTPNNGILYVGGGGGSRIGYIGDVTADVPNIDHFNGFSHHPIRAIDCDPDWSENRQFAVLTSNYLVHVWDLNKKQPILGHKGLEKAAPSQSSTGAMCYLKTKKIIAVDSTQCVIYCVSSNKISLSTGGAFVKNNSITLLKACPYDDNLVAAGTKNGLILIGNVSDFSILHKLRGHDSDITCIDWIKLTNTETAVTKAVTPRPKKAAKSKRKALPIVDENDMFDIYSFDYLENEFGTLSNVGLAKGNTLEEPKQELNVQSNESFDYVEASQNLKEDILRPNNPEGDKDNEVDLSEIPTDCTDGSYASHSDNFVDVNDTLRELDSEDESPSSPLRNNQSVIGTTLCIVTASRESFMWIWDVNAGAAFEKITFKSSQKASDVKFQGLTAKWQNEKTLITNSQMVGILNINKATNVPNTLKPFTSEEVYRISWGFITDKFNSNPHWALFACSKTKLVYFPENSKDVHHLCEDKSISTVSAGKKWLSIGSQDGFVYILKLNGLEIVASCKISNRYLYDCAWNPNNQDKLAACSDEPDIYLFDCSNFDKDGSMHQIGILKGHIKGGVPSIKWSNEDEHKLLSTGFDSTVRVWNVKSLECISMYQSRSPAFCAIFWPSDENYVICSGYTEMDSQHLIAQEKKVNRKVARKNRRSEISTLSESLKDVKLDEKPTSTDNSIHENVVSLELNHTTVFYLSTKEFNKNVMQILNEMVLEDEDVPNRSLHTLLFSGKEEVKKLLEIELENHKNSKTDSVGHVLIPQLNFNLETEINEFVATKTLQPQHVALAPMISFQFWKKCCKALATQYLEKNCCLLAVPYLLAIHEINNGIEQLCNAKYYREAWIIAKVYKESADRIFTEIAKLWSSFLEDGAALIAFSVGNIEMAHKLLSKKRTKTECVEKMIEIFTKQLLLLNKNN